MSDSTAIAERPGDAVFRRLEDAANLPTGCVNLLGIELTDPELPFDRWVALGQGLGNVHRWTQWALGDWLNFGEALYGEQAYAALDGPHADRYNIAHRSTGLAPGTLMNYASTCTRVARSRRRPELSFDAHTAVAKLEADEQTAWLQKAVDKGWGRDELRAEIKSAKGLTAGGGGDGLDRLTSVEQIEYAARQVYQQAQPNGDGDYTVTGETYALLGSALGETD